MEKGSAPGDTSGFFMPKASKVHRTTKTAERARLKSGRRGYGREWDGPGGLRTRHLQDPENWFCVDCGELCYGQRYNCHVDHIIPHTGPSDPRYRDPKNLATRCGVCHRKKTARENNGK